MLKDQKELLSEFNAHKVEYLVVGGHAVNAHGVPRATKDLDVLIRADQANSERVYAALASFGAPLKGISQADFRDHPEQIFQLGTEPSRIDILQSIAGLSFEDAWRNRIQGSIDEELTAPFIGRDDLILNKESTGRARDLGDVEELREIDRVRASKKAVNAIPRIKLLDPDR